MDTVTTGGAARAWSVISTRPDRGFLASHPEFRPAPLADIAALYYQAWNYLPRLSQRRAPALDLCIWTRQLRYISREREWQQTTGFFGKLANSHTPFMNALEGRVATFPVVPALRGVARFEFFENRRSDRRVFGWCGRARCDFALPITTGPKPGMSDYCRRRMVCRGSRRRSSRSIRC